MLDSRAIESTLATVREDTPFVASGRTRLRDDELAALMTRKQQRTAASARSGDDQVFSLEDLRSLVRLALERHEAMLRAEYDRRLVELLSEQYQSFSRYITDSTERQLHSSEFDYMS